VTYGQIESPHVGLQRGICLEEHPQCEVCDARPYCRYPI
jgi:endonuclease III